ncbi:MAG: hydroxyacylglutathione hydrolase [Gammaproteobacteria bacterium]|nr:hydroxyacylglutathione hydrolase [Gammaproteobacteria bacterium]
MRVFNVPLTPIPAFNDNYIWLWQDQDGHYWVVDPGDANSVINHLASNQIALHGILITHHHYDHVGGVEQLIEKYPRSIVVANPQTCSQSTMLPSECASQDIIRGLTVLDVPAHTLDHIAYFINDGENTPILFCGDALFSCGCGRLFEGNEKQLDHVMELFKHLPGHTLVCCAHEYTVDNIKFAQAVEPNNKALDEYLDEAIKRRLTNQPTLPSTISRELTVNPFMRIAHDSVRQSLNHKYNLSDATNPELIGKLREWKDNF